MIGKKKKDQKNELCEGICCSSRVGMESSRDGRELELLTLLQFGSELILDVLEVLLELLALIDGLLQVLLLGEVDLDSRGRASTPRGSFL